jgi:hypothetical protein
MDLAEKITGPLEEALTTAFSQVPLSPRQVRGVPGNRVVNMSPDKVRLVKWGGSLVEQQNKVDQGPDWALLASLVTPTRH